MNKENAKISLYKYLPIILVATNALTILLFLFGFVNIYHSNVNVFTFVGHILGITEKLNWSLSEKLSLCALSIAFVIVLIILIVFALRSFFIWKTCSLTQIIDFKLEYILKLKNIFSWAIVTVASYVMLGVFIGAKVSFLAFIIFVIAILLISAVKFCLFYTSKEDLSLSDAVAKAIIQLIYNVIFFGLCLTLAKPALSMISNGYIHVSWLLPSDAYYKPFYNYNLFFELLTGIFCLVFFIITMMEFVLNTRNDLPRKDYRIRTKIAFGLHIVILALILIFIGLTFFFATGPVNLGIDGAINFVKSIFAPCFIFYLTYFFHIIAAFKKVKDEE